MLKNDVTKPAFMTQQGIKCVRGNYKIILINAVYMLLYLIYYFKREEFLYLKKKLIYIYYCRGVISRLLK